MMHPTSRQPEQILQRLWHLARARAPTRLVDSLAHHRLAQRTASAFVTAKPARFLVRDLGGGKRLATHRLRDQPWTFCLHHGTSDVAVLDEVFRLEYYSLPSRPAVHLSRRKRAIRAVDLGAHIGLFGLFILRQYPSAHVVAFEPDPVNFRALSGTIASNRSRTRCWEAVPACAACADGNVPFAAGESLGSRMVAAPEAANITVPARDVFGYLEDVDILKIDIEGGEWALLDDPRFGDVSPELLFLEYHPHLCPSADPRGRALRALRHHGYEVKEIFCTPRGIGLLRGTRRSLDAR
jgi:FkbM family methyltransferase